MAVINAMCFLTFYSPDLKKRRRKKGQINLYSKLKTGGLEAFQTAIFNGGGMKKKKIAGLVEVSVNTMSVSKALVFEDCSKPQKTLKL